MKSNENTGYELIFSRQAEHYLAKMPNKNRTRILQGLITLSQDPYSQALDIRILEGQQGNFAFRIGFYRIIYTLDKNNKIIGILIIGPRGDVYK
jgi:mRNA-degrading endonuclease RelE of RelBE toxin-antitoxin system